MTTLPILPTDAVLQGVPVPPGRHVVTVSAADYQETKNMEDVGPILPNTRVLRTTVVVR